MSQQSKADLIAERQANLPLPEDPPAASDFNSADATTVNVGSGGVSDTFSKGNDSLRGPSTADSAVRTDGDTYKTNTATQGVGREGQDNLGGLPSDALAGNAKKSASATETRGEDHGYPQKSDPTGKN